MDSASPSRWHSGAALMPFLWPSPGPVSAAVLHVVAHILDAELGGDDSDTLLLAIVALLLLAGAAWKLTSGRRDLNTVV